MKIVIDISEELKHKNSLMGLDRLEKKDIIDVSKIISKGTPLEKVFEDIKEDIYGITDTVKVNADNIFKMKEYLRFTDVIKAIDKNISGGGNK